jgi:hypothetical protein
MATLSSKIISSKRVSIHNLYVEVWAKNTKQDSLLGASFTNEQGDFSLTYGENSSSRGSSSVRVYAKIYRHDELIQSTEDKPVAILKNKIPDITLTENKNKTQSTNLVKGIIATPKGRGIENLIVRAYNKTTRTEFFLSEGKTNSKGEYILYYQANNAALKQPVQKNNPEIVTATNNKTGATRDAKKPVVIKSEVSISNGAKPVTSYAPTDTHVDLLIKVYTISNEKEPIITSPLIINALPKESINLSVGEGTYRGLDTYTTIHEGLEDSVTPETLKTLSTRDVLILANAYSLPVSDVSFYIQARQWTLQWKELPAPVYFGWFKMGMPLQWPELLSIPIEKLLSSIDEAIAKNYVPDTTEDQKKGLEEKIKQWRTDNIVTAKGQRVERGSVGELLSTSKLTNVQKRQLLHQWQNFPGTVDEFWKAQERTLGNEQYRDLELTLQLGAVTRNHLPLIQSIKNKIKLKRIHDLATLKEKDWLKLIKDDAIEVPSDIPGKDQKSKQKIFASQLRRITEELLPTAVLAQSFREDKKIDSSALDLFMERNPEFEFRTTTVGAYLKENPNALGDIRNKEEAQKELEAVQRIFHLTPTQQKYRSAKILWQNQLHSAYAIKMRGKEELFELYKDDRALAEHIYDRASMRHSRSQMIKMQLESTYSVPGYTWAPSEGMAELVSSKYFSANLEALFGDQGFCACKHCDSFFSPSAYLTDLFLYLNKVKVSQAGTSPSEDTALEKLFKRRPDLGNIQLNCKNSHTPLPYIDLVNEVLEAKIVPATFNMTRTVNIFGKNYTLPIRVTPQTESDAATLKAYPQHIKEQAYTLLRTGDNDQSRAFPWILPFNLWMLEVRTYLNHLGISRADLMGSVLGGSILTRVIAAEYLAINPEERAILNDGAANSSATKKYWNATRTELRHVDTLMEKSGYSYDKLTKLLEMRYVQPVDDIVFTPASSCSVKDASIPGLSHEALSRMHKFGRLLLKTNEDMYMLDRAIMAFGGEINNSFLIHYANTLRIEKLLKVKIDRRELLSWWAMIDRHDYTDVPSLYTKLFMIPKKFREFSLTASKEELLSPGTVIDLQAPPLAPDLLAAILSATRLKASDLQLLIEGEFPNGVFTLNLSQLSYLYSVASFCRATKLTIPAYLALKNLMGTEPVTNLNGQVTPAQSLSFIKKYNTIKEIGFEIEALQYILKHRARPKAPFAITDEEIDKILKLLQSSINTQLKEVFPTGTTTREIVETKLKIIIGTNDAENVARVLVIQNIIAGSSTLPIQEQNDVIDQQMIFFLDKQDAKNKLTGGGLNTTEDRFLFALQALDRFLLESAIIQNLSESLALPQHIMMPLLQRLVVHPSDATKRTIDVFLDDSFVNADPKITWTRVELMDQFSVLIKLHKLSLLISTLDLTLSDLVFLTQNGSIPGLPNFNTLPVQETSDVVEIDSWISMFNIILLSREIFKGNDSAFYILSLSLDNIITLDTFLQKLSELSGWKSEDLHYLVGPEKMNLTFPQDYTNGAWLLKIGQALKLVDKIGATAKQMASWTTTQIEKEHADAVRHAAMAKYGEKQWHEITVPLRHNIREAQRDALVQFVLHHRTKHTGAKFIDLDDIYSYFLIDTQMAACTDTSRIVLAASSVQLFVQRIMMNLESGMSLTKEFMKQWKWRKYYRVWEANRKVFIWPENWIEPELRDDKTPLFKELENDLMQNELSSENVEKAYVSYLEKLHEVSHLKICGVYEDTERNVLHVIAQTTGTPPKYYYRRWENKFQWTAWEKIELDIFNGEEIDNAAERGILLTPVVHNRRLFLFWPIFKTIKTDPTDNEQREIDNHKADIDEKNTAIQLAENEINRLRREVDQIKNKVVKVADLEEALDEAGGLPDSITNMVEDSLQKLKALIAEFENEIEEKIEAVSVTNKEIDDAEENVRRLELGHHRYHISIASSQYRDGIWTPKKVSKDKLITEVFAVSNLDVIGSDLVDGYALKNYSVSPVKSDEGSLQLRIFYTYRFKVYKYVQYFEFNDSTSELDFFAPNTFSEVALLDNLKKKLSFMKSITAENPLSIFPNNTNDGILLLSKTSEAGLVTKSFQEGLYKTKNPFFYEDLQYTFFINPPSSNYTSSKATTSIKNRALNSGTNLLQDTVNRFLLPDLEEEEPNFSSSSIRLMSGAIDNNTFFGASDSNQVIIRGKKDSKYGASNDFDFGSIAQGSLTDDLFINQMNGQMTQQVNGYTFYPFYHPYTNMFLKHLNRYGIEGLLSANSFSVEGKELVHQATPNHKTYADFKQLYQPNLAEVNWPNMYEQIDFMHGHSYATYNWELFYHIPLFIATRLSQDQRFDEAQNWFHYIFDPTETQGEVPYRFWKIKPFNTYTVDAMKADIQAVIAGGESVKKQIEAWEKNPFNPHMLARFRRLAYMKTVVMKYLDNLIAWGDQLFRMDTIESMNEATQLYVLAGQILGKLPVETQAKERPSKSFNELAEHLTEMGNAWVSLENSMTNEYEESYFTYSDTEIEHGIGTASGTGSQHSGIYSNTNDNKYGSYTSQHDYVKGSIGQKLKDDKTKSKGGATTSILNDILYFCISPNEKLLSYWDTVADRLFKIRNCMNIEGLIRSVALFQPPIDPALLVKAAAAGVDISSAINDLYAPMPYYRFQVLIRKAQELCQELKSLGGALLLTLEKKDAEQLSLIRSQHEIQLLEANKDIKKQQIEEAHLAIVSLEESHKLAEIRHDNYSDRDFMNPAEIAAMGLSSTAAVLQAISAATASAGAVAAQAPDTKLSTHAQSISSGNSVGTEVPGSGKKNNDTAINVTKLFDVLATITRDLANNVSTAAGYERRMEDWELQIDLAKQEMKQVDKQLLGAKIREQIATKDRDNLELQIENSKQADAYMRNKYTNQELYNWFIGQVSSIYFQTYKMAYDMAKQAEKAFRFELGIESSNYIQFGYWDNLRKGLLSGEKLYQDLNRLDLAYLEKNKRDYEITKHISLSLVSPTALIKLKETGICEFDIPELLFDLDYAGQYFRRIKSVSITIPCVVGPYTSVSAKLTLLKNRVRKNGNNQTPYAYTGIEDSNFSHNLVGMQSVATSQAQGDSGMFELNFRDERYLPFEGAGVISSWRLELPVEFRSFDYDTISDVILHMNYTSRDGGDALKQTVNTHVNDTLNKWMDEASENETGLVRLISMRQEFSNDWHRFFDPQLLNDEQQISLHQLEFEIKGQHFPYFLRKRELSLMNVILMLKLRNEEDSVLAIGLPLKLVQGQGDSAVFVDPLTNDGLQTGVANLPSLTYETTTSPLGWWKVQIDNDELPNSLKVDQANNIALPAALDRKKVEDLYLIFNYTI